MRTSCVAPSEHNGCAAPSAAQGVFAASLRSCELARCEAQHYQQTHGGPRANSEHTAWAARCDDDLCGDAALVARLLPPVEAAIEDAQRRLEEAREGAERAEQAFSQEKDEFIAEVRRSAALALARDGPADSAALAVARGTWRGGAVVGGGGPPRIPTDARRAR